ncbi:MAG: hypothetical protein NVSMB20_05390 [Bradyrhizobium sp.]
MHRARAKPKHGGATALFQPGSAPMPFILLGIAVLFLIFGREVVQPTTVSPRWVSAFGCVLCAGMAWWLL